MSLDACADLVSRGDPDRYATVLAAPLKARRVLLPIYAFNVEVTRAPWLTEEPMVAEMRLQWWRDALEEIEHQKPVRRHEVATPLAEVIDADGARLLDALVAARRWDIYRDAFEDQAALDAYLDDTSAGLMWVAARALGALPSEEAGYRDVGWATGAAALLKAVPDLEARGRKPLADGRAEGVRTLCERALSRLARGRASAQGPAVFPAFAAGPLLRKAMTDPRRVAEGALGLSEFTRRARLLRTSFTGRVPG